MTAAAKLPERHYLNADYRLASWLVTRFQV